MPDTDGTNGQVTAETLYRSLIAEAKSEVRKRMLTNLWTVLQEQKARRSNDFSVALIARLTKAQGGLSESSIRNKGGETYRHLINMFGAEATGGRTPAVNRRPNWEEQVLQIVPDAGLRARLGLMFSDHRKRGTELNLLRNAIQREYLVPQEGSRAATGSVPTDQPRSVALPGINPQPEGEVFPPEVRLLPQERLALAHFLSDAHLADQGWFVTEAGALHRAGRVSTALSKPGFTEAVRKALAALG